MMQIYLVLVVSLFISTFTSAQVFSKDNPAKIHMVLWRGCEEACQGFKQKMEEQGLPVAITLRDASLDKTKLKGLLSEIKQLNPDLVVTWGTSVSKGIIGPLKEGSRGQFLGHIPALFMIVADPIGAGLVKSYHKSGRAFVTGVRNRVPEEVQMLTIKEYLGLKTPHIGVINNPSELNSVLNTQTLKRLTTQVGFTLTSLEYQLDSQGYPLPFQLPELMGQLADRGVDIIYIGSSSYNTANRNEFIAHAQDVGLPIASAYELIVAQSDGLIAVANSYYNVGKLAAKQAQKVLFESAKPEELSIPSLSQYSIFINMHTARKFKLYPPIQLLRLAELVNPIPKSSQVGGKPTSTERGSKTN